MAEDEKASKTLEPTAEPDEDPGEDPTDRYVSLGVRYGLPIVTVAAAIVIGFLASIGPTILTLVTGVLLGAIALLWASLRSLVGDDKLDPALDEAAAVARAARGGLRGERKRIALRALKDLEHEHNIGKIDDDDYERLVTHYRGEAKAAMREIDDELEPYRAKAEKLAQDYLDKKVPKPAPKKAPKPQPVTEPVTEPEDSEDASDEDEESPKPVAAVPAPEPTPAARPKCAKCGTRNDADAAFCKKCGKVLKEPPADEEDTDEEEDEEEEDG